MFGAFPNISLLRAQVRTTCDARENNRLRLGHVPWSAEGYLEVLNHRAFVEGRPHGDWDRSKGQIVFVLAKDEKEPLAWLAPSPSMTSGQLGFFMAEWFRTAGLDRTTAISHMRRYFYMNVFLSQHQKSLVEGEVVIMHEKDPKQVGIATALVDVLARSPYDGRIRNPHSGETEPSFDYATAVRAAKIRMAADS